VLMSVRTESSAPSPDRAEDRPVAVLFAAPERALAKRADTDGPRELWRSGTVSLADSRAVARDDSRADEEGIS
jgi:hypothetical protein